MEPGLLTVLLHPSDAGTGAVLGSDPGRRDELHDIVQADARSGASCSAGRKSALACRSTSAAGISLGPPGPMPAIPSSSPARKAKLD